MHIENQEAEAKTGALGLGLIAGDGHSYLAQDPNWLPWIGGRDAQVGDLLKYALEL